MFRATGRASSGLYTEGAPTLPEGIASPSQGRKRCLPAVPRVRKKNPASGEAGSGVCLLSWE